MFVDASAMVAMMTREDDFKRLAERLDASPTAYTSALALFETAMAMVRKRGYAVSEAEAEIAAFLAEAGVILTPIGGAEMQAALTAFDRYGKGRHPAALNMGDCFAYACAKTLKAPLLYKGDDFARTDLA
jgi:ribonuclease VapC